MLFSFLAAPALASSGLAPASLPARSLNLSSICSGGCDYSAFCGWSITGFSYAETCSGTTTAHKVNFTMHNDALDYCMECCADFSAEDGAAAGASFSELRFPCTPVGGAGGGEAKATFAYKPAERCLEIWEQWACEGETSVLWYGKGAGVVQYDSECAVLKGTESTTVTSCVVENSFVLAGEAGYVALLAGQ